MDTTVTSPTTTTELNSLVSCSVVQNSHSFVAQHGHLSTARSILSTSESAVTVNQNQKQDEKNSHHPALVFSSPPATSALATVTIENTVSASLNLPPPTPNLSVTSSATDGALSDCLLPAPPPFTTTGIRITATPPIHNTLEPTPQEAQASDFDSDTELSIVAAAAAADVVPSTVDHSTTSVSISTCAPDQTGLLSMTNGHINSIKSSSSSSQLSLNTKQQRQQKRRRERAQRLQAERDSRCNLSALSSTLIGGSVGAGASIGMGVSTGSSSGGLIGSVTAPTLLMGNSSVIVPGHGMVYHLNSAGSMGEDSNNSNGNFTSSSNGSNNLLPPTDSIASLLLNPPHSPECNSGFMATPSESEGESLDEDLLSTSSSSTLLLPRDKPPPRPPPPVRRKLPRSPVLEEEIIDGFAILEFKTYEDLEFAIKLGQKRKEKRLSALEELTCTYSIEEMKMPKIIDTSQSHPLRATNLSSLATVSNPNLREINHNHRSVGVGIGSTIVGTTNSINNNNETANNSSSRSTGYTAPLPSMCTSADTEVDVTWIGDQYHRQQHEQLSESNLGIGINIANQISNSQHVNRINQNKRTELPVTNGRSEAIIETLTRGCSLENTNKSLPKDITRSTPLSISTVVSHMESGNGDGNCNIGGPSQDSTTSVEQPNGAVAQYIGVKGAKSTDSVAVNNHISVMISSSCPNIKKLNCLESSQGDTAAKVAVKAGLTLEIQEYTNFSAKVVGSNILLKKEDDIDENLDVVSNLSSTNKEISNICDKDNGEKKNSENLIAFVFPSTPTHVPNDSPGPITAHTSTEYLQLSTSRLECVTGNVCDNDMATSRVLSRPETGPKSKVLSSSGLIVPIASAVFKKTVGAASASLLTPSSVIDIGDKQHPISGTDKLLQPTLTHTATTSSQVTSVSISAGCGSYITTETGQCGQEMALPANTQGSKVVGSQGMDIPTLRPTIPLVSDNSLSQTPISSLHSGSFGERTSNALLPANLKTNEIVMPSSDGRAATDLVDLQKAISCSVPTCITPVVNGFLTGYPSVNCVTSTVESGVSRISPNSGNKTPAQMVLPQSTAVSSVTVTASGTAKAILSTGSIPGGAVGSSLLYHGVPPPMPHLGAGLPMLIQATPYRTPYPNYSLYTPYNSIAHGQYLQSVLPIGTPSTSCSPQRLDARISRESPANTSLKTLVTSASTSHQHSVSSITGVRPITPLGYVIGNNSTTLSVGTLATSATTVPFLNCTQSHHLPAHTAGEFVTSSIGPAITTATLATTVVSSVAANSQLHPPAPIQSHSQPGYPTHIPQLLNAYAQYPPLTSTQQPSLLRCATSSASGNNTSPVLTVQSLPTAMPSPSINTSIASSSTVIQKILSPKCESPIKDRDTSYSISSVRTSGQTGMALSPSICGLVPPAPYNAVSVSLSSALSSTTYSTLSATGPNIASYNQKTALWLNSSMACTSVPPVPGGNARPLPNTRVAGNTISPHAVVSGHVPNANYQHTIFATPLAQPHSSPATPISIAAISSSSLSHLPLMSHTTAIIATMATATTTTSSISTVGNAQSTAAMVSTAVTPTPHPFSAESLFQPSKNDQADLLRRELDSRFLDRSGLTQPSQSSSSTFLRQELHHHQHQHTHLHQHSQLLSTAPMTATSTLQPPAPPSSAQIYPPPLFKDIPKINTVDPQFYRAGISLPHGYAGYSPAGLLHAGLGGPTPFMPPNHLTSFAPKKTGRWNAMHVRIAWEIYYHQNKQSSEKSVAGSSLCSSSGSVRPLTSVVPGNAATLSNLAVGGVVGLPANNNAGSVSNSSVVAAPVSATALGMKRSPTLSLSSTSPHLLHRSGELTSATAYPRLPFEASPLATSFIGAPPSHIGTAVSPFGRYVGSFGFAGLTHFGRDISLSGHLDAWRTSSMARSMPYHSASTGGSSGWSIKPDTALENARREAEEREREREAREREQRERDRQRREREERERKEKEEKIKREQLERERERERKERERREIERREIERERMLQQQRINESNKQAVAVASSSTQRDRSPHRSIGDHNTEIRIKEEHPRAKDEQDAIIMRASTAGVLGDPRFHPTSLVTVQANVAVAAHHHANFMVTGRHGLPLPAQNISRSMMPPTLGVSGPLTHFASPGPPAWGIDPYRDPYSPILRYNPIMEAAFRHEAEERQKALSIYAAQSAAHLRGKEPSPIPPPSVGTLGPSPTHLRMQQPSSVSVVAPSSAQPNSQTSQTQFATIGIGKGPPPNTINMAVQHMMTGDALSHSVTSKKEPEHTMGIVNASTIGAGHANVSGNVMGIQSAPPVTPSR